jgi:DNA-binding MarR family transcriptional regulator
MSTKLNFKYIDKILNVFEIGYVKSNYQIRAQNNPKISVKDVQIIEAISVLLSKNGNNFSNLNKYLANKPSVLSVALKTLEKKGYIVKVKSDIDAREVYLKLTEKSVKVLEDQVHLQQSLLGQSLSEFSNNEKQKIYTAVDSILQKLDFFIQNLEENKFCRFDYIKILYGNALEVINTEYAKFYTLFNMFFIYKEKSLKNLDLKLTVLEYLMIKEISRVNKAGRIVSNKLLAKVFMIDKSTVSNTLVVLTRKGLINRVVDLNNRRKVIIECSNKASKVIDKIAEYNHKTLIPAYLLNKIEENAALDHLVSKILEKLTQDTATV